MKPKRTILNVKLRAGRLSFELWWCLRIIGLAVVLPTMLLGGAQVYLCKRADPKLGAWECIRHPPHWRPHVKR